MVEVLNFIGRMFWLVVLTMVFATFCVLVNNANSLHVRAEAQPLNVSTRLHKTLKLQKVVDKVKSPQAINKRTKHKTLLEDSPLAIKISEVTDNLKKRLVAYWPYRQGIDCAVQRCVALTFDDGPSVNTPALLDIFKSKNAVATFFVTGYNVGPNNSVLRRMINEKHEIGNHGQAHRNLKKIPGNETIKEVNNVQDSVFSITGYRPHVFRPPYGEFRPHEPALNGMPIIFWDNDSADWKNRDPEVINKNIMATIKPGSIVVMHDIYPTTVSAMPKLIDDLQASGYTLVTVTELFSWKDPTTPLPNGQLLRSR